MPAVTEPESGPWRPDRLLDGFECRDLPLTEPPLEGEPPEPLVGTLVRRSDPALRAHRGAVLSVHGWNDYFFHPHVAEFFESLGFALYAVDLRRYGRSLREGQYAGYIDDLASYAEELDAAVSLIRDDHERVVLLGHSTGGLTVSLWAADHPDQLDGLVLNSPWLDMWGPPAFVKVLGPVLRQWGKRNPASVLPLPSIDDPVYAKALHSDHGGEWAYDLTLKTPDALPIRLGWVRAILFGHRRVARGLDITCPVLVTTSDRTTFLRHYSAAAQESDIVLDVDRIAGVSWRLGDLVTLARIPGGMHDLTLSLPEPRRRWFDTVAQWLGAYVPGGELTRAPARSAEAERSTGAGQTG